MKLIVLMSLLILTELSHASFNSYGYSENSKYCASKAFCLQFALKMSCSASAKSTAFELAKTSCLNSGGVPGETLKEESAASEPYLKNVYFGDGISSEVIVSDCKSEVYFLGFRLI